MLTHARKNLMRKIRIISLLFTVVTIATVTTFLITNKREIPNVQAATDQTITDQNGDGIINLVDARILAPPETTGCPVCVDINGDKKIDEKDVNLVQARIGHTLPYNVKYDMNNDKVINDDDVNIVKSYIGQDISGTAFGLDNLSELTAGFVANDIIVKFKPGVSQQQKNDLYNKYGLTPKINLVKINSVDLHANQSNVESLQKQIASEPLVQKTYKNILLKLMANDPNWGDQWGIIKINLPPAWYIGITGKPTIRVGIIDSGADYTHPDLANLSQTKRFDALAGYDPLDLALFGPWWNFAGQDLTDQVGHGTHMTGIIGATANNNKAIAGVNWNVEIIPVRACMPQYLNPPGADVICPSVYIFTGLEYLEGKVDVINLSLGSGIATVDFVRDHINYVLDYFRIVGVPVIAAAGDSGGNGCNWPASYPGVTCVSATDSNDNFASCSSGRTDSDISAPGVDIVSTVPANSTFFGSDQDGVAKIDCGTSMATAYISGLVALCKTVQATNPRDLLKCDHFNTFDYGSNTRRIDAWSYLWYRSCKIFDNTGPTGSPDNVVNLRDLQSVAFLANSGFYSQKLDVFPAGGDGVINGADLYVALYGHIWDQCQ